MGVRFADVEVMLPPLLRAALAVEYPGVYVGRNEPADVRPLRVLVRRQGGSPSALVDNPRVGLNVWAPDDKAANDLSLAVIEAMRSLDFEGHISRLGMTGPAEIQDNSTPFRRRYFTADFRLRGEQRSTE